MKKILGFLLAIIFLSSCGSNERVSKEVFEEVNKSMEVKKLNEVDILQAGMEWGDEISTEAQQQLVSALQKAIEEKGVPGAIEFCNVQAFPILQEVGTKYGVTVRRASNKYRNPADKPTEEEKGILEAYEYNAENELPLDPSIQKFENGEVYLYTKAIKIPNGMCLNCHGEPGTEISAETQKALAELYPEDKATGHKIGDLRGMWSIRIPKKEVVKKM
ncbi:c-type heme family protein [Aquiflexum gelatinilyticum]|uniref:DUF3365 domain-containing protein n=1 Tax=Aquiflexum gelatinilyticum TaxID=2961943 RepID=A0A9X2P640_9BACT|nr:DUF3365 domain-containing protein [Aquiflexum gelatinilyticum]MCR9014202.1 DUF3365 domain-containing protein [Aquiflexum gelatinilyticum]MCS4433665.1 DUF3365 domain-containing protein [Aquiflexum gelatinilyticum]